MIHDVSYFGRRVYVDSQYPHRLQWTGEDGAGVILIDAPITGIERICAGLVIHTARRDYLMTGMHPREWRLWMGGPFCCDGCGNA